MVSPLKSVFKNIKDTRGSTLAYKNHYKPQESIDYMNTLQKSINNRNLMFLNPAIDGTPHLENSIKKSRKYYQEDGESVLYVSGSKPRFKANPLNLDVLDYSAAK